MRRPHLLICTLLVAACSGEPAGPVASEPLTPPTSAAVATGTPTPSTTARSVTSSLFEVGERSLSPLPAHPGSEGASGSGCAPGTDGLPDGAWFGYVVEKDAASVAFDLACFYFGDVAYDEGGADGEEVNNDFYVRNASGRLRTMPVAGDVTVYAIEASGELGFVEIEFGDWPSDLAGYVPCPGEFCGVWLFVNEGVVTEVMEQYTP